MNLTPEVRRRLLADLRRRCELLIQSIDMDAPDLLLSLGMVNLWQTAVVVCGQDLFTQLGNQLIADARQRFALCQSCDSEISVSLSHMPHCEQCEARIEAECEEIDREMAE